ncbi:MAG: UDP-N-acetylmuramoyl-tripeptide--D-alanyl-D-alanine ligase [Candidatus Paceibacterota bacterium]
MSKIFIKILKVYLKFLAKITIRRFKPQVIGITGSVGKTSAKEAVFAVLSSRDGNRQKIRKSEGNLNNELGMPLTILGDWSEEDLKLISRGQPVGTKKIKKFLFWWKVIFVSKIRLIKSFFSNKVVYPKVLILEYAADRPGDMKYLLGMAKPNIAIVTAVGEIPSHVEFFSGPDAVAKEKGRLVESLEADGFAILNYDNEAVISMREKTSARIISFGFGEGADMKIGNLENFSKGPEESLEFGSSFKIEYGGNLVPMNLKNTFGKAQAYASAAAACVGLIFDLNLVEISEALSQNYSPAKGRMNILKGVKGSYVINDAYNASPISMQEALETLSSLEAKRKVAVLGDMLELGKYSIEAHESLGRLAAKMTDILVAVGPRAKFVAEAARSEGFPENKIMVFDSASEACEPVQNLIKSGDLVLIKASRAMGLDRIVEEIKEVGPVV